MKKGTSGQTQEVESNLNQVIDIIQEDISGSATRRKYQTFVTGGIGPGVTSSLYQTVYDQDFTLQTANPIIDMTVGLFHYSQGNSTRPNLVTIGTGYAKSDTTQQISFNPRSTVMMREKVNIYRQYAQYLLGDADAAFSLDSAHFPNSNNLPVNTTKEALMVSDTTIIDAALFLNVKRLFARDGIRRETFAIRLYKNAPRWDTQITKDNYEYHYTEGGSTTGTTQVETPKNNIIGTSVESSEDGVQIIADIRQGTGTGVKSTTGGDVSLLRLASDSTKVVGLLFYNAGIAILNLGGSSVLEGVLSGQNAAGSGSSRIDIGLGQSTNITAVFEQRDPMFGVIAGMDDGSGTDSASLGGKTSGQVFVGAGTQNSTDNNTFKVSERSNIGADSRGPSTFYPDLLVSASIDDIIDHIGYTRFSSGSLTGMAFQNQTKIQSSIYFCRAEANEFNVSNNPTWAGDNGKGVMIQQDGDTAFTYITTVLLYDGEDENRPVAIAKLNRPIEKNEESEVTVRVRLDF